MNADHLWFQNAIEGLFVRNLQEVLTEDTRGDLRRIGINVENLEPAYTVQTLKLALDRVGPLVAPGAPRESQQRELGRRLTRGYFDTIMGRALSSALRLIGPRRGVTRIDRSFRSITNYLHVKGEVLKPGEARVVFEPADGLAEFLTGILQESGGLLQKDTSEVTLCENDGNRCEMRIHWVE